MSTEAGLELSIDGVHLGVTADDERDLIWLAEFLRPAFDAELSELDGAHPRVRLTVAGDEYARLLEQLDRACAGEVEGLGFDGRFSRHRYVVDAAGRTWAHDERWHLFFGVDAGARSVVVVARSRDDHERVALLRVVRELATAALTHRGRLPVHCASFEMDGQAVLICGPKRAGKTSLLVHALRCGAAFVTNDRMLVDTEGHPQAQPMPTVVMLRNGTLDRHPALEAALVERAFDRARTIGECFAGSPPPRPEPTSAYRRRGITPAQFCELLGVSMSSPLPVGLVLFPDIDPIVGGIEIDELDGRTAAAQMGESLLKPSHPTRYSQLFAPDLADAVVDPEVEAMRCRQLVEAVPVRSCRLGPDAYEGDLLDALRRHVPREAISSHAKS